MKAQESSPQQLRRFAFTIAVGLSLAAALSLWRGHTTIPRSMWSVAAGLAFIGAVAPGLLAPAERGWLWAGGVLGWVNTRVILTLLFYLVVTPVGLLVRAFRDDPLDRRLHQPKGSYWNARTASSVNRKSYEHQF